MSTKVAAIAIVISLIISTLLINAGSQGSIMVNGWPLFAICAPIGFLLHWTFFIPSYIYSCLLYTSPSPRDRG